MFITRGKKLSALGLAAAIVAPVGVANADTVDINTVFRDFHQDHVDFQMDDVSGGVVTRQPDRVGSGAPYRYSAG